MVRLTPEARAELMAFCVEHGITATGLIEAFARMINTATPKRRAELVQYARQHDAQKRARASDRDEAPVEGEGTLDEPGRLNN